MSFLECPYVTTVLKEGRLIRIDNAIDYLQSQQAEEHELEARQLSRFNLSLKETPPKLERMEAVFYKNRDHSAVMLEAMSAALEAMKGRKKMKFSAINNDIDKKKTIWIKDDAPVTGVFVGDIHDFKVHWVDKRKQVCRGKDCQYCANGTKANFQFRINLVHKDHEGNRIASIYENDWFTYQRLAELNERFPLEISLIRISKGMDKGYKVDLFEFIQKIDPIQVQGVKLNELEESVADYSNKIKDLSDSPNFDDIPF